MNPSGRPPHLSATPRGRTALALGLALVAAVAACGENAFQTLPGGEGPTGSDGTAPSVSIQAPAPGIRRAVGDSVLVEVRVADEGGVAVIDLSGFSIEGDPNLGTDQRIERFTTKTVSFEELEEPVTDTVITRHLISATDVDAEPDDSVYVVVAAQDLGGLVQADTVIISLGGPRVSIVSPATEDAVRAGSPVRVEISASDPGTRLQEVGVRVGGGVAADTLLLDLDPPLAVVDTFLVVQVPRTATGTLELRAFARSLSNDTASSALVEVQLLEPQQDTQAPTVTFSVESPPRVEHRDTVRVTVAATDSTVVDHVGITVLPIRRMATTTDSLPPFSLTADGAGDTFEFTPQDLGVPAPADTSTLRLEVTAFAVDTASNCGAATVPGTELSESCGAGEPVFASRPGARTDLLLVRGATIRLPSPSDRIADIASDGERVFLSNLSRNRLEVVQVGQDRISGQISVGSQPWGMAFNADSSRLYVANSGGTNISVVSPSAMDEVERIQTPNVKLYDVTVDAQMIEDPDSPGDSISALFPSSVTRFDYSDRPQFIGVTDLGNLIYSTRPTGAAPDGTVRVYRSDQERLEIVTDYAEERPGSKIVIAHADSVFLLASEPNDLIQVCPRNRSTDPSLDRSLPEDCFAGSVDAVADTIAALGYDTRFIPNIDINEIGLSDTTFVAVSGDHRTVAFGEGARENARVMVFEESGDPNGPLLKSGEIRDLVGNTAERVIGLGMNSDGSLGVARGREAYFFNQSMRLQGVVETDSPSGGVDMHPSDPDVRAAFVSGVDENGLAYIDVVDTFNFRGLGRIYIRDPVVGTLRAVRTSGGTIKVYAITARGVVTLDVLPQDF